MILSVELIGDKQFVSRMAAMPSAVHAALLKKVTELSLRLQGHIQRDKLSGQVLHVVSGALRRSIFNLVEDLGDIIYGGARSSGDVKYAGIHEHGGTTRPHEILPRKAEVLSFIYGGDRVFAKSVHHPGSKIPERSYMRSGLTDMASAIQSELKQTAINAMAGVPQ